MNRFLRLNPRNQRLIQSLTPEERRAIWNTVNRLVRAVKGRSDSANQMSDNSALELLCVIGMWSFATANTPARDLLTAAHRHKVKLYDEDLE